MNQKEINAALKEANALKKEALNLLNQQNLKSAEAVASYKKTNKEYKAIVEKIKNVNSEIKEAKEQNKELIDNYIQQEAKLKGLTGLQASLVDKDRARIQIMANAQNLDAEKRKTFESIASLQNDLLNTSSEDVVTQAAINKKLDDHYESLGPTLGIHGQIAKNLREQRDKAQGIANMTEKQQKFLNKQLAVYEGIKDSIAGVLETASLLTSTVGGIAGSLLIGIGAVATEVGKTTREFGGFVGGLTGATGQTTLLSLAFKDASAVTKELANQFGGVEGSTFRTRLNTNLMAVNMGISGESAAKLVGTLARTGGMTAQQAMDLAEQTKQFAKQQGVIPSQAMEDIAQNSELFASYGASATEELAKSAVQAAKLGVSMSTLGKVTDGLLDFESSITKELELSAMLGRNINLNRARGLAFEGKTGAAVKETIKQLGGAAAFEKMNVIQRRQAAEALGLSVDELDKMAKNMDKLNDDGSMQLSTFDTWSQSLTAFASGPMGKTLKGLGSIAVAAGQATPFLKDMGINLGGAVKSTGQILKNMMGLVKEGAALAAKKLFGSGTMSAAGGMMGKAGKWIKTSKVGRGAGKLKDRLMAGVGGGNKPSASSTIDPKAGDGASKLSKSIGKIKMNDVLKGAAALVIIAGAMYVLGKALKEFQGIGLDTLGIAGLALLGLTLSLAAVGAIMNFAGPWILAGAGAMILIAGAMYILGKALQEIAKVPDFDFVSLGKQLLAFGALISPLGLLFIPLSLAALSLGILGAGMAVFGKGVSTFPTGIDFAQLGKDIVGFAISLSSLGKYIFSLTLAGIALGIAGAGLGVFGAGLSLIPVDVLDSLTNMVTNLVPLVGGILSLAGAFTLLAGSLGLLSIAGIAALPTLIALSAVGIGLGAIAGLFGGGSSKESEEKDEESISEYQMMVLTGLTEVRDAINNKNMNVYLDGQLLTDFVRANSDGGGNQGATLLTAKK